MRCSTAARAYVGDADALSHAYAWYGVCVAHYNVSLWSSLSPLWWYRLTVWRSTDGCWYKLGEKNRAVTCSLWRVTFLLTAGARTTSVDQQLETFREKATDQRLCILVTLHRRSQHFRGNKRLSHAISRCVVQRVMTCDLIWQRTSWKWMISERLLNLLQLLSIYSRTSSIDSFILTYSYNTLVFSYCHWKV